MGQALLDHEPLLRLLAFLVVFAAMALWERMGPRRRPRWGRRTRWTANLGLAALSTLLVRVVFPAAAVGAAAFASKQGWGVFPLADWPAPLVFVACVILLDLATGLDGQRLPRRHIKIDLAQHGSLALVIGETHIAKYDMTVYPVDLTRTGVALVGLIE